MLVSATPGACEAPSHITSVTAPRRFSRSFSNLSLSYPSIVTTLHKKQTEVDCISCFGCSLPGSPRLLLFRNRKLFVGPWSKMARSDGFRLVRHKGSRLWPRMRGKLQKSRKDSAPQKASIQRRRLMMLRAQGARRTVRARPSQSFPKGETNAEVPKKWKSACKLAGAGTHHGAVSKSAR